jgi:hypothetical protein
LVSNVHGSLGHNRPLRKPILLLGASPCRHQGSQYRAQTQSAVGGAEPFLAGASCATKGAAFGLPEGVHPGIWFCGCRASPGVWR